MANENESPVTPDPTRRRDDIPALDPGDQTGVHGNLGPGTAGTFQGTGATHGAMGTGEPHVPADEAAAIIAERERQRETTHDSSREARPARGRGASRGGIVSGGLDAIAPGGSERLGETEGALSGEQLGQSRRGRPGESFDARRGRIADRMEGMRDRLESGARGLEGRGEHGTRAAGLLRRGSGAFDSGAQYLRRGEVEDIQKDLAQQIRRNPLIAVGVALGAGFLLGRILRD
jgi:hypothetical protein